MKKLENLRYSPKWVTHLGCVKGCLEYLGIDVSDAWLYGATGHAFVINIHEELCPSGPTAWNYMALFELGKNIGYVVDGVLGKLSESRSIGTCLVMVGNWIFLSFMSSTVMMRIGITSGTSTTLARVLSLGVSSATPESVSWKCTL